jgi:hypothetical protein
VFNGVLKASNHASIMVEKNFPFHHDACQLCCQALQQPLEAAAGLDNVVQSGPQPEDHFAKANIMMLANSI